MSTVDAVVLHKNGPIMRQGWMEEELGSPSLTDELLASEREWELSLVVRPLMSPGQLLHRWPW